MGYSLEVKTLVGGEHVLGSVRWTAGDGWRIDGDIPWVMGLHAVLPAGIDPVSVSPADGEDYMFAAWFTIRGSSVWAELLDHAGRRLAPDEAMAEAERRGRARARQTTN